MDIGFQSNMWLPIIHHSLFLALPRSNPFQYIVSREGWGYSDNLVPLWYNVNVSREKRGYRNSPET